MDCKPIRLLFPWDFPGKNTGVGCHFLLQGIFWCRDWTHISCIAGRFFTAWATRKAPNRLTVECKHNFYMHWETKNFPWLALLWYSLYCGHLAPNPRHLRGLPVPSSPTPLCPACPLFYPVSVFGGGSSECLFLSSPEASSTWWWVTYGRRGKRGSSLMIVLGIINNWMRFWKWD